MPNSCLMSGLFFRGIYNGKKKLPLGSFFLFQIGEQRQPAAHTRHLGFNRSSQIDASGFDNASYLVALGRIRVGKEERGVRFLYRSADQILVHNPEHTARKQVIGQVFAHIGRRGVFYHRGNCVGNIVGCLLYTSPSPRDP